MLTISESIQDVVSILHSVDLKDDNSLNDSVRVIRDEVLENGDSALKSYAQRFDQVDVDFDILVSSDEIKDAYNKVNDSFVEAIQHAQKNVIAFHTHQLPESWQKDAGAGILEVDVYEMQLHFFGHVEWLLRKNHLPCYKHL
jgi:histidinol dehydrogenase